MLLKKSLIIQKRDNSPHYFFSILIWTLNQYHYIKTETLNQRHLQKEIIQCICIFFPSCAICPLKSRNNFWGPFFATCLDSIIDRNHTIIFQRLDFKRRSLRISKQNLKTKKKKKMNVSTNMTKFLRTHGHSTFIWSFVCKMLDRLLHMATLVST